MKKCTTTNMDRRALKFGKVDAGPGPAAYGTRTTIGRVNRMPNAVGGQAYSMKQRLDERNETEGPGPVYNLAGLTCRGKQDKPKHSFGVPLPQIPKDASPGPAVYNIRAKNSRATPRILLPLPLVDPRADNPGPNTYKLPSTLTHKGTLLAKKIEVVYEPDSPGPAVYLPVPSNTYRYKPPKYTLGKKFEDPLVADQLRSQAPGPQKYKPSTKFKYDNMPKYSFGTRRPDKCIPLILAADDMYN